MPEFAHLGKTPKAILMQAKSLAIELLLSFSCAMLAAPALSEDAGFGPPPALVPGQAPPLPQAGPLAEPRTSDQVGFPKVLTEYVISPVTLRSARVELGQKLFFEPRLSGDGTVACATCHDPARAFTDGRPLSIGIHGRVGQRNAPTVLNALFNKLLPARQFLEVCAQSRCGQMKKAGLADWRTSNGLPSASDPETVADRTPRESLLACMTADREPSNQSFETDREVAVCTASRRFLLF